MLTPFLDLLDGDPTARAAASSLRLVFCSGEALAPLQVARFRRLLRRRRATGQPVRTDRGHRRRGPTMSAPATTYAGPRSGRPIDNLRLYV